MSYLRPSTRARQPKPFVAALLSAVIPGAGQIYAGNARRGRVFLAITAIFVIPAALLFVMIFYVSGIGLAVTLSRPFFSNPDLLGLLLFVNALLLVFRAVAVVDAFLIARDTDRAIGPQQGAAAAVVLGLVAILVITAVPHGWVGHRNLLLYDVMTHDFVSDPGQATTTTAPPDGTGSTVATTTTASASAAFPTEGRVNLLLMGGDAGVGRAGIRTDTMIVVSIDPETGWTAMFGIPRNLRRIPVPEDHPIASYTGGAGTGESSTTGSSVAWSPCPGCFPALAWDIYAFGLEHPELFTGPNSGATSAKTLLGYLLGIEIHYFALVDLNGFVDIIDAIGGIDITVPTDLYDPAYPNEDGTTEEKRIVAGEHHLNGHDALFYARSRQQSDDFNRMNRQRCVLEAMAAGADPVELLRGLPAIVPAIEDSVRTDVAIAAIPDFLDLLSKIDTEEIVSIRFMPNAPEFDGTPTSYIAEFTTDGFPVPDRDFIAETVQTALTLPPLEAIEVLNLQPLEDVCG
jgi:polyisoprenyl-teichoic acid--peptidoglycan teichoic acid transferase